MARAGFLRLRSGRATRSAGWVGRTDCNSFSSGRVGLRKRGSDSKCGLRTKISPQFETFEFYFKKLLPASPPARTKFAGCGLVRAEQVRATAYAAGPKYLRVVLKCGSSRAPSQLSVSISCIDFFRRLLSYVEKVCGYSFSYELTWEANIKTTLSLDGYQSPIISDTGAHVCQYAKHISM